MPLITLRRPPSGDLIPRLVQIPPAGNPALFLNEQGQFVAVGGGGGSPAAPPGSVQLNIAGAFGSDNLYWFYPGGIAPKWLRVFNDSNAPPGGFAVRDPSDTLDRAVIFHIPLAGGGPVAAAQLSEEESTYQLLNELGVFQGGLSYFGGEVDLHTAIGVPLFLRAENGTRFRWPVGGSPNLPLTSDGSDVLDFRAVLALMQTVTFAVHDNGAQTGNYALDWANGQKQTLELSGNVTLTMSAPAGQAANYILEVTQVGGFNITWGGNTRSEANIQLAGNGATVFGIYWNGTDFTITSVTQLISPATTSVV